MLSVVKITCANSSQDVFNAAWKLAYILSGKASHELIATYNTERQPVVKNIVNQAHARYINRVGLKKTSAERDLVPEVPDIVCEIGYRYAQGALVSDDSGVESEKELWEDPYHPLAEAGCRAPHVALSTSHSNGNEGNNVSTLDLFKQNFVLFVVDKASPWLDAAKGHDRFKVDAYVLAEDSHPLSDPNGLVKQKYRIGEGEAVLVRPDGYIAWRARRQTNGHALALESALDKILCNK